MAIPIRLPRLAWGTPTRPGAPLLVHGLGSTGALMWRLGTALADAGWSAEAVDLRGHGRAPRALDYSIDAYAADVAHTTAPGGWDAVIGHSLGGAAVTVAAAADPDWTRRLVLIDPGIHLADHDRDIVRDSQERAFADTSIEAVAAEHPHWHPQDVELKALATRQASRWAVSQTNEQNRPWDVRPQAAALTVPTRIIGSDPEVYSIFTGELAAEVLRNPRITMSVVAGAGHSPHRDAPEETVRQLLEALG